MKKRDYTGLNGDMGMIFLVDYNSIDVGDMLDINNYFI